MASAIRSSRTTPAGQVLFLKLGTKDTGILGCEFAQPRYAERRSHGRAEQAAPDPRSTGACAAPALCESHGKLDAGARLRHGVTLKDEIEHGCQTPYGLNYDNWDKNPLTPKTWQDITCSRYGNGDLPPAVPTSGANLRGCEDRAGDLIPSRPQGPLRDAMRANNWPKDHPPAGHDTADDARSGRSSRLRLRERSAVRNPDRHGHHAFQGSGSTNVPVKYFAGFYATGWDVGAQNNGCPDNDPHPWYSGRKSLDNGDVWGHFVNIVIFSSAGTRERQALQLRRDRKLHRGARRVMSP